MKIFAVYTNLKFVDKPAWLDDFRAKYDKPYEFHITLTQPRIIDEKDIDALKLTLSKYFSEGIRCVNLNFSQPYLDPQDENGEGCIMLEARSEGIDNLQEHLSKLVSKKHTHFLKTKYTEYEKNFVPHITIGRGLSKGNFQKAASELPTIINVPCIVDEIILAIVQNHGPEERKDPNNLTFYRLS